MKHIDNIHGSGHTMMSHHVSMSVSDKQRNVKKTFFIPERLHHIYGEVAFREHITLKQLFTNALSEFLETTDTYSCRMFDYGKSIHTSNYYPTEIVDKLRSVSHYQNLTERDIVNEATCWYIGKRFKDKYPGIRGIKDL